MALAYSCTSFGVTYTAASPAETRVSRRSKATTGSSKAMYSMVLFMVDTSLSGFFGIRRQADVRGGHDAPDQLVGRPAGELDVPGQAQLVAQRHQVVEAVARADQGEGDVVAAELVHDDVGGPHSDVDAVLRAHDADVGGQEPAAPAQVGVRLAAPQPLRIRSGPDDRDVRGLACRSGVIATSR